MSNLVAIAVGGAFGAIGRYASSQWLYNTLGRSFPYGTLFVNFTGSFLIGILTIIIVEKMELGSEVRAFLIIGFLGSFTTFSTFSLETVNLISNGETFKALINVVLSVFVCVTACWLGMLLGKQL